jgi:hypothetical protein
MNKANLSLTINDLDIINKALDCYHKKALNITEDAARRTKDYMARNMESAATFAFAEWQSAANQLNAIRELCDRIKYDTALATHLQPKAEESHDTIPF